MKKKSMGDNYAHFPSSFKKILLIMKLSLVLFIAFTLQISASVFSQNINLEQDTKGQTVRNVLRLIENKSDVRFFYNDDYRQLNEVVSQDISNGTIEEMLAMILGEAQLTYKIIENNFVVVYPEGSIQQSKITGTVTDATTGEPLPGVNILLEGTRQGVITDVNGKYSIDVPGAESVLVFSFVGYLNERISVASQNIIDVRLSPDIKSLDEIVVIGYGTTTKANLSTAISQVKPDDVPASANNSVNQLLFGRAAGLSVTQQSAEPGGTIDLSIRGRDNPLIVIDGIVIPSEELEPGSGQGEINGVRRGGLADINPSDIESIEILKDASAAIYGVSASDGVILITTKKGKAGKMKVSYDGSRSFVQNMPYLEPLTAKDYMTYYNLFTKEQSNADPKFSDTEIQNAGEGTDWLGEVLRNGSVDNHSLTISGGSEKLTYYFSGNYFNQVGTMKNSELNRYTTRMNTTFNFTEFLRLNTTLSYSRNNYTNSTAGWQTGGSGTQGFGALQAALSYPRYLPIKDSEGEYTLFSTTGNPVTLLNIADNTSATSILGNISLEADIIKNMLTVKLIYGNNYENAERNFYIPGNVFWGQIYQARGTLSQQWRQNQTMEGIISFNKELGSIVKVSAVAGMGQYIYDEKGNTMVASNMLDAIGTNNMGAAPTINSLSSNRNYEKRRSYFIRSSFDILDRYLVSLAYRLDGIDKFFPSNKYASFPSASIGWKISNESFMDGLPFVDLVKVRASIGITGNAIGDAAYGQFEPDGSQLYFDNGSTIYTPYYQTRIDQPELKWEKTLNTNIGLDFGFFKNRISGSVDVFQDKVTNLLTSRPTDQLSFIASAYENDGVRIRNGYELTLRTVNVSTSDFQWDMLVNISHYLYRWDERFKNQDLQKYVGIKDPVNATYVFETNGILQTGDTPSAYQPAQAQMPGAPIFVDKDNNDTLDYRDVTMFNTDPKIILGFGNNFRYKNLDLSIFFYGYFGAKDFNYTLQWADPKGIAGGSMGATVQVKDAWSTINPNGIYPGVNFNESALGLPTSIDTRLASKNFVRCRNITLGYTFKSSALRKYLSNLRLYFDVQNPFIFTKYVGIDPEIQQADSKGGPAPYPMARTYSFGINASF